MVDWESVLPADEKDYKVSSKQEKNRNRFMKIKLLTTISTITPTKGDQQNKEM